MLEPRILVPLSPVFWKMLPHGFYSEDNASLGGGGTKWVERRSAAMIGSPFSSALHSKYQPPASWIPDAGGGYFLYHWYTGTSLHQLKSCFCASALSLQFLRSVSSEVGAFHLYACSTLPQSPHLRGCQMQRLLHLCLTLLLTPRATGSSAS